MTASTTRVYSPPAGPLATVAAPARARAGADRAQRVLELFRDDLVRRSVDARRADVDLRGEPVEVALAPARRRGVAGLGGRRRDVALRAGDRAPALARALVGRAAVDAQQVAGLVLLRLHADHALFAAAEHLGQGRRAQAFPVLEVVALFQPQRGVVVHDDARRAALRRGQRARALALERRRASSRPGLEALSIFCCTSLFSAASSGPREQRVAGKTSKARIMRKSSWAEPEHRQGERALDHQRVQDVDEERADHRHDQEGERARRRGARSPPS